LQGGAGPWPRPRVIINSRTGPPWVISQQCHRDAGGCGCRTVLCPSPSKKKQKPSANRPPILQAGNKRWCSNNSTIKVDQGSNRMFPVQTRRGTRANRAGPVNDVGAAPGDLVAILESPQGRPVRCRPSFIVILNDHKIFSLNRCSASSSRPPRCRDTPPAANHVHPISTVVLAALKAESDVGPQAISAVASQVGGPVPANDVEEHARRQHGWTKLRRQRDGRVPGHVRQAGVALTIQPTPGFRQ